MKKKIILIHGYTSSPNRKKYKIIASELQELGVDYAIPKLPGGLYPQSSEWLKIIDNEVKLTNKPVVLVGHSLGTRAVLLYLDKFDQKVDTVILFSAFNNDITNREDAGGNFVDFFEYKLDIEKIKKLANKFIVVHSKDDNSIPYTQGVEISKDLGAKLITYDDKGHFSGEQNAIVNAKIFVDTIKSIL
jgi:predicted alpha/beta hydrolase family esterase